MPTPPDAYILYKQTKEMGIPLVAGGLQDQPYIWLEQYAVCMLTEKQWAVLNSEGD